MAVTAWASLVAADAEIDLFRGQVPGDVPTFRVDVGGETLVGAIVHGDDWVRDAMPEIPSGTGVYIVPDRPWAPAAEEAVQVLWSQVAASLAPEPATLRANRLREGYAEAGYDLESLPFPVPIVEVEKAAIAEARMHELLQAAASQPDAVGIAADEGAALASASSPLWLWIPHFVIAGIGLSLAAAIGYLAFGRSG